MDIKLYKIRCMLVCIVLHGCSGYSNYNYINQEPKLKVEEENITQQKNQKEEDIVSLPHTTFLNQSIKSLLNNYLRNASIEDIYLLKVTRDDIYYRVVNDLKTKLTSTIKDKVASDDKFYVIIEQSANTDLEISSAIILKLYNKNNISQIKILPIVVGSVSIERSLFNEFRTNSELSKISIKVDSKPKWFREQESTTSIYLANLIEVVKLSIEYKSPNKVPNDKIEEVMTTPYSEYEKSHQELFNSLKLTNNEAIDQSILADKHENGSVVSGSIKRKRMVSWDPLVEDNEGHTIRRKKHKSTINTKAKDEIEEYFKQCITSWHWDQTIWEEKYKVTSERLQHLLDKYCDRIRGKFGGHILNKHHYDCPNDYDGCKHLQEDQLNKIIDGYIFLIGHCPNLLNLFREYQKSMLKSLSQCAIDMLGFYNNHPKLKLINLIEKRVDNIDKADREILVNITNCNQENVSLKLTGNIVHSSE